VKLTGKQRLERGAAVLETLAYCREVTSDESLGEKIERYLVDRELEDIALCTTIADVDRKIKAVRSLEKK
jgi:hypothetical protein